MVDEIQDYMSHKKKPKPSISNPILVSVIDWTQSYVRHAPCDDVVPCWVSLLCNSWDGCLSIPEVLFPSCIVLCFFVESLSRTAFFPPVLVLTSFFCSSLSVATHPSFHNSAVR